MLDHEETLVIGLIIGYERDGDGSEKYPLPSVYISELAINPQYQKQGLGRFLIEKFIEHNSKLGMRQFLDSELSFTIQTNSDEALNSHVINLYQSFGFKARATKVYENRIDLIMEFR